MLASADIGRSSCYTYLLRQSRLPSKNTLLINIATDESPTEILASQCRGKAAPTGINDQFTRLAKILHQSFDCVERLLPRVPRLFLGIDVQKVMPSRTPSPVAFGVEDMARRNKSATLVLTQTG